MGALCPWEHLQLCKRLAQHRLESVRKKKDHRVSSIERSNELKITTSDTE